MRYVLAADAYLEMGDQASARTCIAEASESEENIAPFMAGITKFTTGPVIIGVLVRIGAPDRALQALVAKRNDELSIAWTALGQFCSESQQVAFVEAHFDRLPTPSAKAYFAIGVAIGLRNVADR